MIDSTPGLGNFLMMNMHIETLSKVMAESVGTHPAKDLSEYDKKELI